MTSSVKTVGCSYSQRSGNFSGSTDHCQVGITVNNIVGMVPSPDHRGYFVVARTEESSPSETLHSWAASRARDLGQ